MLNGVTKWAATMEKKTLNFKLISIIYYIKILKVFNVFIIYAYTYSTYYIHIPIYI